MSLVTTLPTEAGGVFWVRGESWVAWVKFAVSNDYTSEESHWLHSCHGTKLELGEEAK